MISCNNEHSENDGCCTTENREQVDSHTCKRSETALTVLAISVLSQLSMMLLQALSLTRMKHGLSPLVENCSNRSGLFRTVRPLEPPRRSRCILVGSPCSLPSGSSRWIEGVRTAPNHWDCPDGSVLCRLTRFRIGGTVSTPGSLSHNSTCRVCPTG